MKFIKIFISPLLILRIKVAQSLFIIYIVAAIFMRNQHLFKITSINLILFFYLALWYIPSIIVSIYLKFTKEHKSQLYKKIKCFELILKNYCMMLFPISFWLPWVINLKYSFYIPVMTCCMFLTHLIVFTVYGEKGCETIIRLNKESGNDLLKTEQ